MDENNTDVVNNHRQRFFCHVALGLIPFVVSVMLWPSYRVIFDATGSIGGGLFFVVVGDKELQRDDIAVFHPPANRFYDMDEEFIKRVGAVGGDTVERIDRTFYIQGYSLGTAKKTSLQGEPLEAFSGGVVPAGHYYFYSTHKDAFDSRYQDIGWIDKERVVGKAYSIF